MSELDERFPVERSWDYENGFYLTSEPARLGKLLAHYELYQRIVGLPGIVMELGVYKAASLIRLATFRELVENQNSRKIVGFDAFGQFPRANLSQDDADFVDGFEAAGGDGLSRDEVDSVMRRKGFGNIELVPGDVLDTLPEYLRAHPETRIAFLHLDMDVYEPTAFALRQLFERVVVGGLVVIDDYSTVAGATDAVDEFIAEHGLEVHKGTLAHVPAYIVK